MTRANARASGRARLQFGTLDGSSPIAYGFHIGSADVSTLGSAPGWASFWGSLVTQRNRWEIIGFSDCEGGVERNAELRLLRAMNVNNELPRLARAQIVRFRAASLAECVAANDTAANRAFNRSVVFRLAESSYNFEGEVVTGVRCPPASGAATRSLSEYTALVACAERTTGYTPRQMLAMLRQLYYGKPWSATSQTDRWDNVIPCSLDLGNPEHRLGTNLYNALRNSAEVAGVDVGHVFTGLEAMMCPSGSVSMAGGLAVVNTPNEDFATWAGDLGAAAASSVVCPQLGAAAATNEDCFGRTGPQPLAFYAINQAPPTGSGG